MTVGTSERSHSLYTFLNQAGRYPIWEKRPISSRLEIATVSVKSGALMSLVTQFPTVRDGNRRSYFRAVFEGAAAGIAVCRLDGWILEANPAFAGMLGYGPRGVSAHDGTGAPGTERKGGRRDLDSRNFVSDGFLSEQPVPKQFLPGQEELGELIRGERKSVEIETRNHRRDGSDFWGHLTVSLGRDERREPAFLILILADATERKRMEEHLRSAEKMEVIGRMAGGIAHDFNNLLTGILLYCELVSTGLENGTLGLRELTRHVDEVRMAGEQGVALTQQLLATARKQTPEPVPSSIDEIVRGSKNLLRRLIGERMELVTTLNAGTELVLADPGQLRQVLLNLVLNARDAMPRGGRITVSTRVVECAGEVTGVTVERTVALTVKDLSLIHI